MAHIAVDRTAGLLRVLAEPIRIRILHLLGIRELCVCQIVEALGEPQYKVSRHLGALRDAGVLKGRREGTWMHYAIDWSIEPKELALLRMVLAASADDAAVAADAKAAAEASAQRRGAGT